MRHEDENMKRSQPKSSVSMDPFQASIACTASPMTASTSGLRPETS